MDTQYNAQEWLTRFIATIEESLARRVPRQTEEVQKHLERTLRLARILSAKVHADVKLDTDERVMVGKILGELAALEGTERAGEIDVELGRLADVVNDDSPVREFKH